MLCKNCGAQLPENETKCPACGKVNNIEPEQATEIGSAVGGKDEPRGFSNKRNVLIIAIAAAVLLAGGIGTAIGINAYSNSSQSILSVAQRYLNEKNYEQAILEFTRVLELDPTNIDAYLGLAEAYVATGDIDKAIDILQKGVEVTGDGTIKQMLDRLRADNSAPAQTTAGTGEQSAPAEQTSSATEQTTTAETTAEEEPEEEITATNDPECNEIAEMISAFLDGEGEIDIGRLNDVTELRIISNSVRVTCGNRRGKYITSKTRKDRIEDVESDIPFIFDMPNLKKLSLVGQSLKDVTPLTKLTNLKKLYVSSKTLTQTDFAPLESMTNLTELSIESYEITDITPLIRFNNLPKLSHFYVFGSFSDITPITGMTKITELGLGSEKVTDISPLAGMTKLTSIELDSCKNLSDISPLAGMTKLTYLELNYCENLSDISPIAGLTNLKILYLSQLGINDLSPIAGLSALTDLEIFDCRNITDISALSKLSLLQYLNINSGYEITDFSPLYNLNNLVELYITDSPINDLSPLSGMTSLERLDLDNCPFTDLSPLNGLNNLEHFGLEGCPVPQEAVDAFISTHPDCEVMCD